MSGGFIELHRGNIYIVFYGIIGIIVTKILEELL